MKQRVAVLVLIGLPAAGKTTFCRQLVAAQQRQFKIIHLCYDDFFEFPQNLQQSTTMNAAYKAQRAEILQLVEAMINVIKNEQEIPAHLLSKVHISTSIPATKDYIVICDDNHYYRSMRYKLLQLSNANNCAFAQIYFECDLQRSLQRNSIRTDNTRLPQHILQLMAVRLEAPKTSNPWEATTLTLQTDNFKFSFDSLLPFLCEIFEKALESKTACEKKSVDIVDAQLMSPPIHQLDLLLRRRVGELLCMEHDKDKKQIKAASLSTQRKEILRELRGHINLNESEFQIYMNLLN